MPRLAHELHYPLGMIEPGITLPVRHTMPWVAIAMRDRAVRTRVAGLLREDGYRVLDVDSSLHLIGELAEVILHEPLLGPDCLVVDVARPSGAGVSLLEGLRDLGWMAPAILVMTAPLPVERALVLEPIAQLTAPTDVDTVHTAVRAACPLPRGVRVRPCDVPLPLDGAGEVLYCDPLFAADPTRFIRSPGRTRPK